MRPYLHADYLFVANIDLPVWFRESYRDDKAPRIRWINYESGTIWYRHRSGWVADLGCDLSTFTREIQSHVALIREVVGVKCT